MISMGWEEAVKAWEAVRDSSHIIISVPDLKALSSWTCTSDFAGTDQFLLASTMEQDEALHGVRVKEQMFPY